MTRMPRLLVLLSMISILVTSGVAVAGSMECFTLGARAQGCQETVDHIVNLTVVSRHANVYRAEYNAGYIQGRLQKRAILAVRDNNWDSMVLVDPSHSYPERIPPSHAELLLAQRLLMENYAHTVSYIDTLASSAMKKRFKRLLFRLLGIYHGAASKPRASLDFSGKWVPDLTYFEPAELIPGYETSNVTFADIYFINGFYDLWDVVSNWTGASLANRALKCSAFLKKTPGEIILAHNWWGSFLAQSMSMNLFINGDLLVCNAYPGQIGSATDFGYNNKGIMFNETTHSAGYMEPKTRALWMFFRAALAEQFGTSLDDFYRYLSLEPSGTYLNGYMVADVKDGSYGLVEMSYKSFIYFKSDGNGGYRVITRPKGLSRAYDTELLKADAILGINYPISFQIRDDLQSLDTRPARRTQFLERIGTVEDVEKAKALITYTAPDNPLSIFGRWDLGYGLTPTPKTVPDGALDAKVVTATMVKDAMTLQGTFSLDSTRKSYWMKFGTPYVNGLPFIWSISQWSDQKLRQVPDVLDGQFRYLNLYLK